MKEERLAILKMLEKGIITAEEADRLLSALYHKNEKDRINNEEVSSGINSALSRAGSVLGSFVRSVGEKAEGAKKEIEPFIKMVAQKAEDMMEYADKLKKDICRDDDFEDEIYEEDIDDDYEDEEEFGDDFESWENSEEDYRLLQSGKIPVGPLPFPGGDDSAVIGDTKEDGEEKNDFLTNAGVVTGAVLMAKDSLSQLEVEKEPSTEDNTEENGMP